MTKMDRDKIHFVQNNRASRLDNATAAAVEKHACREQEPRVG
jgi:hypothetical protein